jgi:glycosyltransferase involved in cell wall biosynthesis
LELLGRVDDKDHVYSLGDILVLPSRNEGIALTSYEAIARGMPVVSADVGAQNELLPSEMLVDIWQCNPLPEFVSRIVRFAVDEKFKQVAMERARVNFARLAESSADMEWLLSLYVGHEEKGDSLGLREDIRAQAPPVSV